MRYIDDFVLCFQNRQDALRVQDALCKRLARFNLKLEPIKTNLVAFGRFAQRNVRSRGIRRPETIYCWGSRSTARKTRRAISGWGRGPRSHASGAVLPAYGS